MGKNYTNGFEHFLVLTTELVLRLMAFYIFNRIPVRR